MICYNSFLRDQRIKCNFIIESSSIIYKIHSRPEIFFKESPFYGGFRPFSLNISYIQVPEYPTKKNFKQKFQIGMLEIILVSKKISISPPLFSSISIFAGPDYPQNSMFKKEEYLKECLHLCAFSCVQIMHIITFSCHSSTLQLLFLRYLLTILDLLLISKTEMNLVEGMAIFLKSRSITNSLIQIRTPCTTFISTFCTIMENRTINPSTLLPI